jgi:predicted dehydrogenase
MIRIGLVDFDTSHVQAFTQRLNQIDVPQSEWVEGAQVVAACPGVSEMMPERIPGYRDKLIDYGVEMVASPAELIGRVDAVMVESQQGNKHLAHARLFLEAGLPVFVDKPFSESVADAEAMIALAQRTGLPLMSCSSLRYDPTIVAAKSKQEEFGRLLNVDVWTPAALHEGNPGMLHYAIHGVEMLYTLVGGGCQSVAMTFTEQSEVATGIWPNGYVNTVRGVREGSYGMGFVAHYEKGHAAFHVEGAAFYREMLKAVVTMFETGEPPIPYAEMREIIAFIAAAEDSCKAGGIPRPLA